MPTRCYPQCPVPTPAVTLGGLDGGPRETKVAEVEQPPRNLSVYFLSPDLSFLSYPQHLFFLPGLWDLSSLCDHLRVGSSAATARARRARPAAGTKGRGGAGRGGGTLVRRANREAAPGPETPGWRTPAGGAGPGRCEERLGAVPRAPGPDREPSSAGAATWAARTRSTRRRAPRRCGPPCLPREPRPPRPAPPPRPRPRSLWPGRPPPPVPGSPASGQVRAAGGAGACADPGPTAP